MKKIKEALEELNRAIEEEECCVEYRKALEKLKEDPEMFVKLNEFRKKNMEYHMGDKNLMDESVLWKEYESFLTKEEISGFLAWEQKVTDLYRSVFDAIAGKAQLDYSFLDE